MTGSLGVVSRSRRRRDLTPPALASAAKERVHCAMISERKPRPTLAAMDAVAPSPPFALIAAENVMMPTTSEQMNRLRKCVICALKGRRRTTKPARAPPVEDHGGLPEQRRVEEAARGPPAKEARVVGRRRQRRPGAGARRTTGPPQATSGADVTRRRPCASALSWPLPPVTSTASPCKSWRFGSPATSASALKG
jgi:hypothetical protein